MINTKQENDPKDKPSILFATEGVYPYTMGGVSSWSYQLIDGLGEFDFKVMTIINPHTTKSNIKVPKHATEVISINSWRPRQGVARAKRLEKEHFYKTIDDFLAFPEQDIRPFAKALIALAEMGNIYNLWPLFETRQVWETVRSSLIELTGKTPLLGEISLTVNWLRSTLVPLLFVPPHTDLVHVVTNGLCIIPAYVAARVHRKPLLFTEHGIYLRERYLSLKKENDPHSLKLLRARFYKLLIQLMYVYSNRVTSVSNFSRYWQLELGVPEERIKVIPNGVNPKSFPLPTVAHQDNPTIVWIGHIEPLKDLETLLDAFVTVKEQIPHAKLRLFGSIPKGNEAYGQKLITIIEEQNLTPNARFEGPISSSLKAYHAADVVVLSSISEGFPYTVIEAMMCGKPVVSTQVGGVGDIIDDDVGRLVPLKSPISLARALLEVLRDKGLREKLGKQALQKALEQFTLQKMCSSYQNTYLNSLKEPIIRLAKEKNIASRPIIKPSNYLKQLFPEISSQFDNVLGANKDSSLKEQSNKDIMASASYLKQLFPEIFFQFDNILSTNKDTSSKEQDSEMVTL